MPPAPQSLADLLAEESGDDLDKMAIDPPILVASMIASRLLLGPCAALQQVQVLLEVAIQHHYDIMPAQDFEHRFQRLHGPSQETKLKLQLLLASLRSKCAATPEGAAGAAISIPRGMSARGIN